MRRLGQIFLNIPLVMLLGAYGVAHSTGIKKCQDEDGNWHYGNFADTECAQDGSVTKLNSGGEVVGVEKPPPTQEELDEQNRIKKEAAAKKKKLKQQIQHDQNIVRIYGSEDVIISTRDRKLESIDSNIEVTQQLRKGIVADLDELKSRKQTKKINGLIKERENAIKSYDQVISQSKSEREKLELKYEDILKSFRDASDRLAAGS